MKNFLSFLVVIWFAGMMVYIGSEPRTVRKADTVYEKSSCGVLIRRGEAGNYSWWCLASPAQPIPLELR